MKVFSAANLMIFMFGLSNPTLAQNDVINTSNTIRIDLTFNSTGGFQSKSSTYCSIKKICNGEIEIFDNVVKKNYLYHAYFDGSYIKILLSSKDNKKIITSGPDPLISLAVGYDLYGRRTIPLEFLSSDKLPNPLNDLTLRRQLPPIGMLQIESHAVPQ